MGLLPCRFLTPFPHRLSRRLRNSACSLQSSGTLFSVNPDLSSFCLVVLNTSSPSDSQAVLQLIKWEIFNINIPFYGNIGVYLTGFALDSSVFWPFYPILLSDSELQHSLSVRFPRRTNCKESFLRLGRDLQWSLQPSPKALFTTEKRC